MRISKLVFALILIVILALSGDPARVEATAFTPPQSTQEYLQHLVGQRLILRHYAGTSNPKTKEKDLINKTGGCHGAVEVVNVAFEKSSLQLELRNIGSPTVRRKDTSCMTVPDLYSFKVTYFDLDQPRDEAENAIGHLLQTPEAYLAAHGIVWDLAPPSENELPVDFP